MLKTVKRVIGIVVLVSFLITFLYFAYIRVTNSSPSLFGVSILRVNSDDMEPSIKAGEIIVIKKVNPAELKKGDVITYRCEVGGNKGNDITHQISKEPYEFNGEYYFTTRSLSMGAVDDPEIKDDQIIGKAIYLIPYLGTMYDFFTNWYGMVALAVVLIILFSDEIIGLIKRFTVQEVEEDDFDFNNINDLRQSEHVEVAREKEFQVIITDLEETEE